MWFPNETLFYILAIIIPIMLFDPHLKVNSLFYSISINSDIPMYITYSCTNLLTIIIYLKLYIYLWYHCRFFLLTNAIMCHLLLLQFILAHFILILHVWTNYCCMLLFHLHYHSPSSPYSIFLFFIFRLC